MIPIFYHYRELEMVREQEKLQKLSNVKKFSTRWDDLHCL